MSADALWAALSLLILAGAALGLEAAWRAPRCEACGVASEEAPAAVIHTIPAVFEIVYRCPRCRQVVSRRRLPAWD
ncbi:MAG: hypothetical protein ACRELW_11145 [Candidatus Rokuibacteriota bacterium]